MRRRRHPEDVEELVQPSEPGIHETLSPEMTVVARGARVEGTLVSAESIRIDGHAKGEIAAPRRRILSSHSEVEADIQAHIVVTREEPSRGASRQEPGLSRPQGGRLRARSGPRSWW
jgi:hypothetical protein